MTVKSIIKSFIPIINYLPFNNKFPSRGLKKSFNKKIFIGTKVYSKGKDNSIVCSDGGKVKSCRIHIAGNNNQIFIGKNTSLLDLEICIEDDNNIIKIGDNTTMYGKSSFACIEGTKIEIGNNCLFSSEITFRTGDSHSVTDIDGKRINPSKDIVVGDKVWIGNKVIVTKGVHVAGDCIIGTGSVVTKSINESNVVVAGVPARVVKENVSWNTKRLPVEELEK